MSDIEYSVIHETDEALAKRISQNIKYDQQLKTHLNTWISGGFTVTADRRKAIINDP